MRLQERSRLEIVNEYVRHTFVVVLKTTPAARASERREQIGVVGQLGSLRQYILLRQGFAFVYSLSSSGSPQPIN